MRPGEVLAAAGSVELFGGRQTRAIEVVNDGDRPIQVGSHYHFAEANPALRFDRAVARGHRLAIPAGTSVRFEPGIEQTVALVAIAGDRVVAGLRGDVAGPLDQADQGGTHRAPVDAPVREPGTGAARGQAGDQGGER